MTQPPRIHLFQGYGVELEYMLVDRDTLQIKPITDELLKHELGEYGGDFENGIVTWSNELVLHVVELKSTKPEHDLAALEIKFAENVKRINSILLKWNAMLLPTAAHPFMEPASETKLWPHENNEVYAIYNKIFDCRGHGWSNLQSTHLNLPFYDDEEFAKLHAAIRLVLPILPALCASSPILDGKVTGLLDTRLKYYKTNQAKIPSITGKVIPEAVFSKRNYLNTIYEKIKSDIAPYDPGEELNAIWVNSRGAIPRFDRGSIEIRVMDIQECPAADIAVLTLVIETIKALTENFFTSLEAQMKWKTEALAQIFDQTIVQAQQTVIDNSDYLNIFNFPGKKALAGELWQHIFTTLLNKGNPAIERTRISLKVILQQGTLAYRIVQAMGKAQSKENIVEVYKQLSVCLSENKMF
ncbi:glutamate-cysteine ligase family protein [Chryseolinea sp. H1M3-3]|uniref:carboxylate-amine ligase n=1 Tax=Chryseolinea sp. H1M3-3 TaxID=3034144 RepID=UPI0023EAFD70|nr:glutamate-cysteine ligase family protein [Chryseolinea sp. H1M3-3]